MLSNKECKEIGVKPVYNENVLKDNIWNFDELYRS